MSSQNLPVLREEQRDIPQLAWVDSVSRLLDTRFRIPGTDIRFGADFVLGLLPFGGDLISLLISGTLITTMARNGASGMVVAKMLGNVALDATVGAVPVVGDLFDLTYKANYRNLQLMREHYGEGRHRGSVWPVVIGALVGFLLILAFIIFVVWQVFSWLLALMGLPIN